MRVLRHEQRGAAAAVISVILVILLAGAMYWFACNNKVGGETSPALELAKLIPSDSLTVWAWDLNGQVDFVGWATDLKELQSQLPPEPQEDLKALEEKIGMSLEAWLKLYDGRGFVAVTPGEKPDEPGVIGVVGLTDGAEFDAWWQKYMASYESRKTQEIDGVSFSRVDGKPPYVGHDDKWVYFADSESSAKKVLAAVKGGNQNLDSLTKYQEGLKELGTPSAGLLFFVDNEKLVGRLKSAGLPGTDDKTFTELSAIEYLIGTADLSTSHWEGFCKISGESDLAKQLLLPGRLSSKTLTPISGKVTSANSLDLRWAIEAVLAIAKLSTETREMAVMGETNLSSMGDPWAAFNGDITISGNTLEAMAFEMSEAFGEGGDMGKLTACRNNMDNLGVAMEMYSVDWYGKYPKEMGQLTPTYLKTIPECPAAGSVTYTAVLGLDAGYNTDGLEDYYLISCAGSNHPMIQANYPQYDAIQGLMEGDLTRPADSEGPSNVIVASLKDMAAAHSFLNKLIEVGGEPPKEGEEKEYLQDEFMIDGSFKLINKSTPLAVYSDGSNAQTLLDTSSGTLADSSMAKEVLSWAPDGIVYLDFVDLEPAYNKLHALLEKRDDDDAKLGLVLMEKLRARAPRLDGGSSLVVKSNGIHYRSVGISVTGYVGVGVALLLPNLAQEFEPDPYFDEVSDGDCQSNLENIGVAVEMYATDWNGEYPKSIGLLTPNYLLSIPECPNAGRNTYSETYKLNPPDENHDWDVYEVHCSGENHLDEGIPENYPAYNGVEGLVLEPGGAEE